MAIEQRQLTNGFTELYISGGVNFLTQAKPTVAHEFYKTRLLATGETVEDWREVTPSEKTKLEAADAAFETPPQAFHRPLDRARALRRGVLPGSLLLQVRP